MATGKELFEAAQKLIADERQRQIEKEGWTPEHDDAQHKDDELMMAAMCYRFYAQDENAPVPVGSWPWSKKQWKPKDRLKNLVRAGALYLAAKEQNIRRGDTGGWYQNRVDEVAMQIRWLTPFAPDKSGTAAPEAALPAPAHSPAQGG